MENTGNLPYKTSQLENRNFLSGINFKFVIRKCPGVEFFCQAANIPGISLQVAYQNTLYNTLPIPGDEVDFDDLNIRFMIDEDLQNYMEIHRWIRTLGHPESFQEMVNEQNNADDIEMSDKGYYRRGATYSTGILYILNSNMNPKFQVVFDDCFPISLNTLEFDSTYSDTEYLTGNVSFKYSMYHILKLDGTNL